MWRKNYKRADDNLGELRKQLEKERRTRSSLQEQKQGDGDNDDEKKISRGLPSSRKRKAEDWYRYDDAPAKQEEEKTSRKRLKMWDMEDTEESTIVFPELSFEGVEVR